MSDTIEITPTIKARIEAMTYERDGVRFISIGNSRLDFSKEYHYLGCTKKTIKLAWKNGTELIPVQGKVFESYNSQKIYTESCRFIEKIPEVSA